MQRFSFWIPLSLLLAFLAACNSGPSQRISLTLWLDTNEREMAFFKQSARQFEKQHPHLRLKLRFLQFQELKPRFQGQGGDSREPDLLYLMNDWVGELAEQNLLRPLQKSPSGLLPQALNSMKYQGKLYAAPFAMQTIGLIYRPDKLKAPPRNHPELMSLKQHLPAGIVYALLYEQRNFYYHAPWFHACGGKILDEQGHIAIQAEPLRRSLRWAQDLQRQQLVPPHVSAAVMLNLFSGGEAALMISGPWALQGLRDNQRSFAVAPLPHSDCPGTPQSLIGVKGFGINNLSAHPREAEAFLHWLSAQQSQLQVLKQLDNLPVHHDIYKQPLSPEKQAFYQQIQNGRLMPNSPIMKEVWQEMNGLLTQVLDGKALEPTLENSLKRLQDKAAEYGA